MKIRGKYSYLILYIASCLTGIFMMFYPMLISNFDRMQTDTGDTRLNNYFLEHSFQFVFNHSYLGGLWSPKFFFPYKEVLAFSDNLFGSAPMYWLFRFFSSSDIAFQLWMIAVSVLNFITFSVLMRKFKVNHLLSTLAAFLFAFGLPRITKIGHQQLLPQFFTPLAFIALWNFIKKPSNVKLAILLLLTYLQLLAGVYLGWFWIFSLFLFLGLVITLDKETRYRLLNYWSNNKKGVVGIVLIWLVTTVVTFLPYVRARFVFGQRSYAEVDTMIPRLASWFSPPDNSLWNPILGSFSKDIPMIGEHHLFMGFILIFLTGISVFVFLRKKSIFNESDHTLLIKICFLTFSAIFILSIRLPFGVSLWSIIYALVPGASVIRAVSRIWTVAYFYLLIATFVCFDTIFKSLYLHIKSKWLNLILILIFVLGVAEQSVAKLPSYEKEPFLVEVHEIRDLIKNNCAIAYVIPNVSKDNKFWDELNGNMQAMWAGIEANVPVINGYSGNVPPQYSLNTFEKFNISEVSKWLNIYNLNSTGKLCIVVNNAVRFKDSSLEIPNDTNTVIRYDSKNFSNYTIPLPFPKTYKQNIQLINFDKDIKIIDQTIEAIVTIENNSTFDWSSQEKHPVNFSYRWFDETGKVADFDKNGTGIRTSLPSLLKPSQKIALIVSIKTPPTNGKYNLVLSMVEEGITWFYENNGNATQIPLEISSR